MSDLDKIPTEALVDAIARRAECVIAWTDKQGTMKTTMSGAPAINLGLAEGLRLRAQEVFHLSGQRHDPPN